MRSAWFLLSSLTAVAQLACWDSGQRPGSAGAAGMAGTGGTGGATPDASVSCADAAPASSPENWVGIIGTGQSLATGDAPAMTTTQPYNNLKLSLGTVAVPPWDPNSCGFSMLPLVEPIRPPGSGFPRPYPGNIWGETPHTAMANQITALVRAAAPGSDYVTVHTVVGESGQGMVALKKQSGDTTGTTGRAYAATLFETAAITRLARAAGRSYAIGAMVMTHGETDSGSSTYKNELIQLLTDSNADLAAITGQATPFPMLISQQFAYPSGAGQRPAANQIQWRLGVERPGEFICTGPKYHLPGNGDGVHLSSAGYRQHGEKLGQIFHERIVRGADWQPLQPIAASRSGRVITVRFHVPVPPLGWEEAFGTPSIWPNGRGFELRGGGANLDIASVAIAGDAVEITCATDPPAGVLTIGYAMTAGAAQMPVASRAYRWGQLRDSDPFVGSSSGAGQENFCVAFEMDVPAP